jgi:hypothetical protein
MGYVLVGKKTYLRLTPTKRSHHADRMKLPSSFSLAIKNLLKSALSTRKIVW